MVIIAVLLYLRAAWVGAFAPQRRGGSARPVVRFLADKV
jgi:hypothetical protein